MSYLKACMQKCMGIYLLIITTGCGSPSFTEDTQISDNPDNAGSVDDGANAADQNNSGDATGENNSGDTTGQNNNDGSNGNNNDPTNDPAKILVEDGGTLDIPGVKATKVGINFEDSVDMDYNDAVLCFVGNFKIDGSNVVSYQKQTVTARTSSISACQHRIDVKIINTDGTTYTTSYKSNETNSIALPFDIQSRLEVTMTVISGGCMTTPVSMHSTTNAIVDANECRTTGN